MSNTISIDMTFEEAQSKAMRAYAVYNIILFGILFGKAQSKAMRAYAQSRQYHFFF